MVTILGVAREIAANHLLNSVSFQLLPSWLERRRNGACGSGGWRPERVLCR